MDPRIDAVRAKMEVRENESFTKDYYDLEKRAIGNSIQVHFADGTSTERVEVQYPIGHRNRRDEGIPVLKTKFENSLNDVFSAEQKESILSAFACSEDLDATPASEFLNVFVKQGAEIGQLLA